MAEAAHSGRGGGVAVTGGKGRAAQSCYQQDEGDDPENGARPIR
jgi:hypothetical protein